MLINYSSQWFFNKTKKKTTHFILVNRMSNQRFKLLHFIMSFWLEWENGSETNRIQKKKNYSFQFDKPKRLDFSPRNNYESWLNEIHTTRIELFVKLVENQNKMQNEYSMSTPICSTQITILKYISFTIIFTKIEHSHIVLWH